MRHILTINAGSSSIKFALFTFADEPAEVAHGQIEGLGVAPKLTLTSHDGHVLADTVAGEAGLGHEQALTKILGAVNANFPAAEITAVGHRVVHGGTVYSAPTLLTDDVVKTLESFNPLAPLHQPHNLSGIAAARRAFPSALQVACFDTAFHRSHPWVNDTFALPRRFYEEGVRRYGFHGLSYEYVTQELSRIAPEASRGRTVVAHLGNGASMCAIKERRSVGSTMGFSALDGLPMGTRCGQLDPGVVLYLIDQKGMSGHDVQDLLYKESGLKGLSGLSHDMRALHEADTLEAREAIDYFVFRIRRELGAMTAILSGLDTLVFCGGIGEHDDEIRERVTQDFQWLGIELDETANRSHKTLISSGSSRVNVFVIKTNEELMIARHTGEVLRSRSAMEPA